MDHGAGRAGCSEKSENSAVKAFISKVDDFYRSAFAHRKEVRPRQLIFVATTNEANFLRDETGGRRWWIVDLKAHPDGRHVWDKLTEDEIGQIWAEAVQLYKNGEDFRHLDYAPEAVAKELQENHREDAPKKGLIEGYLDLLLPEDWAERTVEERRVFIHGSEYAEKEVGTIKRTNVCAAEVWCELYQKDLADMKRSDTKEINDLIEQIGGWAKQKPEKILRSVWESAWFFPVLMTTLTTNCCQLFDYKTTNQSADYKTTFKRQFRNLKIRLQNYIRLHSM